MDYTPKELYEKGFCFHTKCRSDFQKIEVNQQRASSTCERPDATKSTYVQAPKVSRRETISFDKNLCLFCQKNVPSEPIYSVCQTSRDQVLKDAFHECPTSLALYSIRSSHAYDAMAGDIIYHNSCWRTVIDKRSPEVQTETSSHKFQSSNVQEQITESLLEAEPDSSLEMTVHNQSCSPHEKSIQLRNGRNITLNGEYWEDNPDSWLKEVIISEIIEGLKIELSCGNAIAMNNLVKIYKSRMTEYGSVDHRTDKAIRIELRRIVGKCMRENGWGDFGEPRKQ